MSREAFTISQSNPNENCGGGGCACSESAVSDCDPPYAVFYANDMENPLSPHVVVCLKCATSFVDRAQDEANVLAAGETAPQDFETPIVREVKRPPKPSTDSIPEI